MTTAKEVPALVAAHQDALRTGSYRYYAFRFFDYAVGKQLAIPRTGFENLSDEKKWGVANNWVETESNMLNIAGLYHVSDSMTEVAKVAASQLDPAEKWNPDVLPSRNGVLVFERPLAVVDVWKRIVTIAAATWTYEDGGTSFVLYTDITTKEDHYNQLLAHRGELSGAIGRWSIAHMERHVDGHRIGEWFTEDSPEFIDYKAQSVDNWPEDFTPMDLASPGIKPVFANAANVFYSVFALMDQTITNLSEETDKRLARRNRNKLHRPPPMVTVITLRREAQHGYREPGTGIWLNYRSITRGHWRRQHYGHGRELVKRIWVHPYWRGGEDLPVWSPKRVSTLVR